MIRMLTAHTFEIDDVEAAVSEIMEQLNMEQNLLTHAAGMLTCYAEFVESGVVTALCERLPFDVVGCTTLANATSGENSALMLTLSVLTSDDLRFATALSDSLVDQQEEPLREAYERALAALPGKPTAIFEFLPLIFTVGGDQVVGAMDRVTGGVPQFGTVTVDNTPDYTTACVIYNGQTTCKGMAMLLVYGDFNPTYAIASVSDSRIMMQKALITASQNNVIYQVNNIPILAYLESLGLSSEGRIDGANAIPFIIDYNDGTKPVARSIFSALPDGGVVCGGVIPIGATLSIGSIDFADVMNTTSGILEAALAAKKPGGLLMFSCLTRNLALGMDTEAEMRKVQDCIGDAAPYQFTYSGGEVCPVYGQDGRLVNRFHNATFITCVF
ncbi:MAG: FIST C-terminal domain-containing protein [Oscillospiraceae bacterium]|nr:FIST C-terminal domain-containing protein [Oscillospiraceae bacterium]